MVNEESSGLVLPGWLRYGLDKDGKHPSARKQKKTSIQPMSEHHKQLAKSLSDEIWRQRMIAISDHTEVTITLRDEAVEGLEKILWALAEEDYAFANVRIAQLINGLLRDAPQWRDDFEEES